MSTSGHLQIGQIVAFLAVAGRLGFRAAADDLFLSQPAVSRRVAGLESAVGMQLLHRLPGGVELTPAGRTLLAPFEGLIREHDLTLRAIDEVRARNHDPHAG